MNFSGSAEIHHSLEAPMLLMPQSLVWTRGLCHATRTHSQDRHECLTLIFPDSWLQQTLCSSRAALAEPLASLLLCPQQPQALCTRLLTTEDHTWARSRMGSHLCEGARKLLEVSQLTSFLITEAFPDQSPPEAEPLSRTERLAQERIEKVKEYLLTHLEDSPSLEQLALVAGCSTYYLSRSFSQQEGVTLSNWMRRTRINTAAQLLASGSCNVSEASLRVGYRSFSHFSQAFAEQMGVPPSRWLQHLSASSSS